MKYTNILVGTDGTALMDAVFDECAYLARLMGATIHVAYVLDATGVGAQPLDATWEGRYVIIKSEARQILNVAREALVKRGVAEASITEILLEGHATEEISKYVEDHAIDLIVIGTHGRKGFRPTAHGQHDRQGDQNRHGSRTRCAWDVTWLEPNWRDEFAKVAMTQLKYLTRSPSVG